MSKRNNRDTQDYYDNRYDDQNNYYKESRPVKPVIEDDRNKTRPQYINKEDRR